VTLDGYLPEKDYGQSEWIENNRNGFPLWRKSADYMLSENTSLFSLIHEKEIVKAGHIYLAEATGNRKLPLIRGLFTDKPVDEVILYILPLIVQEGIHPYSSVFPVSTWFLKESRTFPEIAFAGLSTVKQSNRLPDFPTTCWIFRHVFCCIKLSGYLFSFI
jgi:hypothetical protein